MNDISNINKDGLPTTKSLIKATVAAALAAAVILITAILPAEYGVDPTGIGRAMGLNLLNRASAAEMEAPAAEPLTENLVVGLGSPVFRSQVAPRTDTLSLTLQPGQGAEIKSKMEQGDSFVFGWKTEGGTVFFDMHGEPPNAGNDFTSYWVGKGQPQASGNFTAPFAGTHGWYWENTGQTPVTITLTTSGFYGDLYMP